jgi:hypothetical protein
MSRRIRTPAPLGRELWPEGSSSTSLPLLAFVGMATSTQREVETSGSRPALSTLPAPPRNSTSPTSPRLRPLIRRTPPFSFTVTQPVCAAWPACEALAALPQAWRHCSVRITGRSKNWVPP